MLLLRLLQLIAVIPHLPLPTIHQLFKPKTVIKQLISKSHLRPHNTHVGNIDSFCEIPPFRKCLQTRSNHVKNSSLPTNLHTRPPRKTQHPPYPPSIPILLPKSPMPHSNRPPQHLLQPKTEE